MSAVIELRLSLAYPQCSRCHKPILGCHWPLLNFQDVLYRYLISKCPSLMFRGCQCLVFKLRKLSLTYSQNVQAFIGGSPNQDVITLFSKCSGCHCPSLMSMLPMSGCHWPSSMFRLPMSCLQIAQAVIDLFSECSGCHWRISNQDVTNLFSKCSGCHWPSSMFKQPMSCLQIAQAVIDLFSECSGCHWRIPNQDGISLFSKCSGCHCHCQCSSS